MNPPARHRFDLDALRERAGDKFFARGQDYFKKGQVEILANEPARVLARVTGTEVYRTVLTGQGKRLGGECSCPAFEDWGVCKHMIAAALTVNALGAQKEPQGPSPLQRIHNHLATLSAERLAAMVLDLAERDDMLFQKLELASASAEMDPKTLDTHYRKAIDNAVRTGSYLEYDDVPQWKSGVAMVLEALASLADQHAALKLSLADHAFAKIEAAIDKIDDSDGLGVALLEEAARIHHSACHAARSEPVLLARMLFIRETKDQYGFFSNAAENYAGALGKNGLAEYLRLATEAWQKLPPLGAGRRDRSSYNADYDRLSAMLDFFAQRSKDLDMRIALRSKDLSSPMKYLHLAKFCLSQGRADDALARAEEGLWLFEDDCPDEALIALALKLMISNGRKADAAALLAKAFAKAPSLALYGSFKALDDTAAREKALAGLERAAESRKSVNWRPLSELLIEIHMADKNHAAAWLVSAAMAPVPRFPKRLPSAARRAILQRRWTSMPVVSKIWPQEASMIRPQN